MRSSFFLMLIHLTSFMHCKNEDSLTLHGMNFLNKKCEIVSGSHLKKT